MSKEEIYDEQISPLMGQILTICQTHKIAMLMSFATPGDAEGDDDLACTSALLSKEYEPHQQQKDAFDLLMGRSTTTSMITVKDEQGRVKEMAAIVS